MHTSTVYESEVYVTASSSENILVTLGAPLPPSGTAGGAVGWQKPNCLLVKKPILETSKVHINQSRVWQYLYKWYIPFP